MIDKSLLITILSFYEIIFFLIYFSLCGLFVNRVIFKDISFNINSIVKINLYGLLLNYLLLAIWNIYFPINYIISNFMLLVCVFYLIIIIKQIKFDKIKLNFIKSLFFFISLCIIFWLSNLSLNKLEYEPIYYLQKIRWAQQYPLIKGIGNLHNFYGADSSIYLYLAFLDNIIFISRSFWSFSGYLLSLGFLYFFIIPTKYIFNTNKVIEASYFARLLFTPLLIHNCFYMHPSIGTDLLVFIFASILCIEFFKYLLEKKINLDFLAVCLLLAFISKMSFIPTFFIAIFILFGSIYLKNKKYFKQNSFVIFLVIITFFIQIHRNIISTGYPIYPSSYISLPVAWKMDPNSVDNFSNWISWWAMGIRNIDDLDDIEIIKNKWIKTRFFVQHRRVEALYPLVLAMFGFLYILLKNKQKIIIMSIFILPALAQIIVWYFYAPDTRFSSFAFWWIGAGLVSPLIKYYFKSNYIKLLPLLILSFSFSLHAIDSFGQVKNILVYEISEFIPKKPKSNLIITRTGLNIWVPINNEKCDDSPLPCTDNDNLNKNLGTIIPGKIESGFIIKK
tara:strand:- start:87 stop:1772 length:1686 start_codon:yes stop_codon:yes gene_type:complete